MVGNQPGAPKLRPCTHCLFSMQNNPIVRAQLTEWQIMHVDKTGDTCMCKRSCLHPPPAPVHRAPHNLMSCPCIDCSTLMQRERSQLLNSKQGTLRPYGKANQCSLSEGELHSTTDSITHRASMRWRLSSAAVNACWSLLPTPTIPRATKQCYTP